MGKNIFNYFSGYAKTEIKINIPTIINYFYIFKIGGAMEFRQLLFLPM